MSFSLDRGDEAEFIEGVETFKYLVQILDRSDYDFPKVHRNVVKACQVWGWIGKLIRREGVDPRVSAMFYHAVVQTVLLFEAKI